MTQLNCRMKERTQFNMQERQEKLVWLKMLEQLIFSFGMYYEGLRSRKKKIFLLAKEESTQAQN